MEWGRAKTILIIAFFILNLLLLSQLADNTQKMSSQNPEITEFSQDVRNLIQDKNIDIRALMPVYNEDMQQITVTFTENSETEEWKQLAKPIARNLPVNSNVFHEAIEQQVPTIKMSDFAYDEHLSDSDELVYHQLYRGLPMFEVNLKLLKEEKRVVAYQRDVVSIKSEDEQNLITSYAAVSTLIENYLRDYTVIKSVQLGYHGQLYNSQKQFLTPYWRIILGDGMHYYVHAINGAVEAPVERESSK